MYAQNTNSLATPRLGGLLIVLALLLAIAASIVFPVSYYMARDDA